MPASAGSGGEPLSSVEEVLSIPAAGSEPQELFTLATDRICRLLGADRVMLFAAEGSHLRPRSARGFRRDDLDTIVVEAGDGIVGRTFTARRALTASSIAAVEDAFIERFPVKEAIAVPVRAEDDVVGVLYAGRRADGRPFGPSDVLLLLVIADRMGSAFVHQSLLDRRSASIARLAELAEFAGRRPRSRPDGHPVAGGGGRMPPRGCACGSRGRRRGGPGGGRRTRTAGRSGFLAVDLAT